MAEIIPDEGLDLMLAIFPKGGSNLMTMYCGLFTGATAATTPLATAVLSTYTGVAEAAPTSYARQPIANTGWGATAVKTIWAQTTRGCDGPQVSFPAAGAVYAIAINGFFLCDLLAHGSEKALMYSNFQEGAVASLALGDIIRVTPTFGLLG